MLSSPRRTGRMLAAAVLTAVLASPVYTAQSMAGVRVDTSQPSIPSSITPDVSSPAASSAVQGLATLDVSNFPVGEVVASYENGVLSRVQTPEGTWVYVLRVAGAPADMGRQYGYLVGSRIPSTWNAMMNYMGARMGLNAAQAEQKLSSMMDRAYGYMDPYISKDYKDELTAIVDGAKLAGVSYNSPTGADLTTVMKRMLAITNISDLNAYSENDSAAANKMLMTGTSSELDTFYQNRGNLRSTPGHASSDLSLLGRTCSFFAAWGGRAQDGKLFASRNLDWASDTGLGSQALVTIYKPTGANAYATMGYIGVQGAMAGMNAYGLVVSEVGATSTLEKLKGQPWTLKLRETLSKAVNLDQALPYMTNYNPADRVNRPSTLGYNFLLADGDADGRGYDARTAVLETNGGLAMTYVYGTSRDACRETPQLYVYGRDGKVMRVDTPSSSKLVNAESSASEVDAAGNVRKFKQVDGQFVRTADGYYLEDPYGVAMTTGKSLSCSVYRGEEALGYGARIYQTAANGPSGLDPRAVMNDSQSFEERYARMNGVLYALSSGGAYTDNNGINWVQSSMSSRPVGMNEAELVSRAASMDTSLMNVVYNATDLKIRLSYEAYVNGQWSAAGDNSYIDLDLGALFNW